MAGEVCDTCETGVTVGVASSSLGPVSFAYCRDCLAKRLEPRSAVIGFLMGYAASGAKQVLPHVVAMLTPSLEFHGFAGISDPELWEEVRVANEGYERRLEEPEQ